MKILLIATNQSDRFMDRMVVRPVPIGLAYIAAAVDEARHEMRVLDLMFSEDAPADIEAAVRDFAPDVVGLSMRNLDNQSYFNLKWNLPGVREIADRVRRAAPAARIVCGGPAFSILPAECLRYVGADLGIAGDAAEAFATLIERLDAGADFADVPGVVYRGSDGEPVVTEGKFAPAFHNAPRLDLLDMRRYDGSGFGVGVVTKLAQAYYPTVDGGFDGDDWRVRDPSEVIAEIADLNARYGIAKIFFIDSGFNVPLAPAKTLCRALIESGVRIRWSGYVRAGGGDDELAALMKRSGCSLALIAESGKREGLRERLAGIESLGAVFKRADLPFALNVGFGEPGETEESVGLKLGLLDRIEPAFAAMRLGTRILPRAPAALAAMREGMIKSESELLEPIFYIEPATRDWLPDRLRTEAARRPRWNLS